MSSGTDDISAVNRGVEMPPGDLYVVERCAAGVNTLADVNDAVLAQYREQGFLVIERAFSGQEIADALAGIVDLLAGRVAGFEGVQLEPAAAVTAETTAPEERQDLVRKLMYFAQYEPRLSALAHHPKLLSLLTRILGDTPAMFQDMALLKPPHVGREKPWHQDHAYFDYPLGTPIAGVWIALDEATLENGCMHVLPGGHLGGPIAHFNRRDWQICDTDIIGRKCTAVPLAPGGCLIFDGLLPHGTPHNHSSSRRRAVQFHYRPASAQSVEEGHRLKIFGSEGRNVTC